jgi:hypothetical protein
MIAWHFSFLCTFTFAGSTRERNQTGLERLFGSHSAPKCLIHRQPAKELTVAEHGPNKVLYLFSVSHLLPVFRSSETGCLRPFLLSPVGPGYDKVRSET